MSFQYYNKPIEELQQIATVIAKNFSAIIGCSLDSQLWSPATAHAVCDAIIIAGTSCSNISDQSDEFGDNLSFRFISSASSTMKDIWQKVLGYDKTIYDLDKLSSIKISNSLSIEDKLKLCCDQSKEYDSTIYQSLANNSNLWYTDDYKRLCWILLACFSIRYELTNFVNLGSISGDVLNESFITKVEGNIVYEKYMLSDLGLVSGYEYSTDYIGSQLSILLKNCKQLRSYVLSYIR